MMLDLTGKTVLVTGGNQGIGWAVAELLARQGARVAVNYPDDRRSPANLAALGPDAIAIEADVGDVPAIRRMFATVEAVFGGLDVLVNNAGIFPRSDALHLDEATWDAVHGVNLKGTFFCAQEAARLMIPRGGGRIVNIASVSGVRPSPRGAHYCASKAGVIMLTKSLALEWASHRIAVNAVAPGLIDTAQPRDGMSEEEIAAAGVAVPWGRIGQPVDVARVVLYLATEMSDYVTGDTIFVTGGGGMA